MIMRRVFAGLVTFFLLASLWHAGDAHAQDPTPTYFPELEYVGVPTHTMTYTESGDEVYNLIPISHSEGLTLSLDIGFWTYDNFVTLFRTANTVKSLGNQYHILDILFAFAILALALGPLVQMIRARSRGSGGGG